MALLIWIIRFIVLLIIIRFAVVFVRQMMGGARAAGGAARKPRAGRTPERIGGTLVQDPQCGTYLPQDRAIVVARGGETTYFCSTRCRDEWAGRAS
jgi:uncharacterized protein